MLILQIICLSFTISYVILMILYRRGWRLQPQFKVEDSYSPFIRISVIIPARDEARNIGNCIESLLAQDYPRELLEVIVVDDHSSDNTAAIVESFGQPNIRCIALADYVAAGQTVAYKKAALSAGIANSNGELIITTDADCVASPSWLRHLAAFYEMKKPVMIAGPVDFTTNGSFVQLFQSLDFMSMQGITAAANRLGLGSMSNGANLAFSRDAFNQVEGYKGVDHLASGDDYLLMVKMQAAFPGKIGYLKAEEAIVRTPPQPDWTSFFQQRIRWASKSGKYDDSKITGILSLVYLFNFSLAALLIAGLFYPWFLIVGAAMLIVKIIVELWFLYPVAKFYNKTQELLLFPFLQPLHIAYIVSAGLLGFIGVYKWKGRTVK
ncbi:glycosyltransferase [Polluticoccus soli]|uniref:glycosyltransferase n=1 Tax=Polluticoccus soli TaxID=3034150 RepID=UPI0023E2B3F4|nr:glycosyltransferase [Flavipsychrobacter sp. JY13-12]